jgi:hypothetical protein
MIVEYTRPAKCKDCAYIEEVRAGKLKRHICSNDKNPSCGMPVRNNDDVCYYWKIKYE